MRIKHEFMINLSQIVPHSSLKGTLLFLVVKKMQGSVERMQGVAELEY